MRLDLTFIRRMAEQIRLLAGDDDECFFDTLDGETDAADILDGLLSERAEALALAKAAKEQAEQLRIRAKRIEARAEARQAVMLQLLDAMGVRKVERPAATVSRRSGGVSVRIESELDVPTQMCRIKREPDKAAIKKALEAGEDIPGAELVRGEDSVTVRIT